MKITEINPFIHQFWQEEIVPQLVEYIKIPNKSPAFDSNWKQNGHMEEVLNLAMNWKKLMGPTSKKNIKNKTDSPIKQNGTLEITTLAG